MYIVQFIYNQTKSKVSVAELPTELKSKLSHIVVQYVSLKLCAISSYSH